MKKVLVSLSLAAFVTAVGCGRAKYSDVNALAGQMADAMEAFGSKIESAQNGKEVAAAMNGFNATMKKLVPQMEALQEKYPELKDQKEPPPEFKETFDRLQAAGEKMGPAMMKVMMQYADDPDVQKAMEEMGSQMPGGAM